MGSERDKEPCRLSSAGVQLRASPLEQPPPLPCDMRATLREDKRQWPSPHLAGIAPMSTLPHPLGTL